MPVVPWVKKQGLFGAKVLAAHCVHVDEGEIRALKNFRRRRRPQPDEQPEARRRRRAGREDAGARSRRRHRHRRRRVEQRPRHVRGDAAGGAARQRDRRRSRRRSRARSALAMATRIGARGAAPRSSDRLARARQARRPDRPRSRSACTTCRPFGRDPNGIYAQIVYASKSTDVVDVMCNGRWLMRDRRLLTLDETELRRAAAGSGARASTRSLAAAKSACCRSWSRSAAPSSRRASRCRSRRASPDAERALAVIASDQLTVIRSTPLPPVRHLLVVRRSGAGPAALSGRRIPRRGRTGHRRPRPPDAHRPHARGALRRRAAVPLALSRARRALGALLSRVLPAGDRTRRGKGTPALAGGVSRRRVLRPPRSAGGSRSPTAISSR